MEGFKGTPGKWVASKYDRSIGPVSNDDDQSYGMILPVAWVEFNGKPEHQEADANLIAAAPELLEALQRLVEHSRTIGCNQHDYPAEHPLGMAYSAIKKALGQ